VYVSALYTHADSDYCSSHSHERKEGKGHAVWKEKGNLENA